MEPEGLVLRGRDGARGSTLHLLRPSVSGGRSMRKSPSPEMGLHFSVVPPMGTRGLGTPRRVGTLVLKYKEWSAMSSLLARLVGS